jgi:hypothetical protein
MDHAHWSPDTRTLGRLRLLVLAWLSSREDVVGSPAVDVPVTSGVSSSLWSPSWAVTDISRDVGREAVGRHHGRACHGARAA